jgi:hypothetical protein
MNPRRLYCGACYSSWDNVDGLLRHVWLAGVGAVWYCNPRELWRHKEA